MTSPKTYRKKHGEIQAMRWDGTAEGATPIIDWILSWGGTANYWAPGEHPTSPDTGRIEVRTIEGDMRAMPSDLIIRGIRGEFYPCNPEIFAEAYEEVDQ